MFSTSLPLFCLVATILGAASPENTVYPRETLRDMISSLQGGRDNGSAGLAKRIYFNHGDTVGSTWTYDAQSYNISMSLCLDTAGVAGPYNFVNGRTSNSASISDINADLHSLSGANLASQTLANANAAYSASTGLLYPDILCDGTYLTSSNSFRQLLDDNNVQLTALLVNSAMTAGIGVALTKGFYGANTTNIQLAAAATIGAVTTFGPGIINMLGQAGVLAPVDALIINVFLAVVRKVVLLVGGDLAPATAATCVTDEEAATALTNVASYEVSDWTLKAFNSALAQFAADQTCDGAT